MRFMWAQVRACLLVAAAAVTAAAPERLFKLRLQEGRGAAGRAMCARHCGERCVRVPAPLQLPPSCRMCW